jgi:hypothetical protein
MTSSPSTPATTAHAFSSQQLPIDFCSTTRPTAALHKLQVLLHIPFVRGVADARRHRPAGTLRKRSRFRNHPSSRFPASVVIHSWLAGGSPPTSGGVNQDPSSTTLHEKDAFRKARCLPQNPLDRIPLGPFPGPSSLQASPSTRWKLPLLPPRDAIALTSYDNRPGSTVWWGRGSLPNHSAAATVLLLRP